MANFKTNFKINIPRTSTPYNFDYSLSHYVFQPWMVERKKLVRLYKTPNSNFLLLRVGFNKNKLDCELLSHSQIDNDDQDWIRNLVSFMFAVNEPVAEFYDEICAKDPVLKAASKEIYGAHLRRDATVFESVIGVIVAQNVFFKRIYKMLELLCRNFGEKQVFGGISYFTFPEPQVLANAKLGDIRACLVGYRDKYIKGVAEMIVKENLNLDELRNLSDVSKIREKLIELPGVGPYTADLVIAIGFSVPSFHLDLFTREVLYTFYFKGKKVSDEKLKRFVEERWGRWKHYAMLLLTTNTDDWAKELGVEFRLKSAAKKRLE
ncbi:hypothetical protein A3D01_05060 [Candidatus Woesebacteria bacterium RIFCSPHIGHO2_02_FULL_39_13]|uniref:DNA-(apurinic or apyrimidinic site) lyase n=1 Tax=Candidatus Woesebacteria bacterium RIFCSPHIGHO2_02_FULL_39_13 TaxID=1802505 RepID=A0A1F7Z0T3_9BACT|nr:MAG: hypothetical protein A2692_00910 [Candidatus Woesebacteria bacterium RIFCSPHIGHO2_01_FULL_39_95]OGM33100.1 MAG: hypothetical protein A3D01_05060 [Candidatus Woesebacteria bacterium RIFCSPHIGHO2_02_FULL_39_13]OGM38052.1 MAG: hypothetical protein A3E13_03725 [Candidatus Woesebacteria bacterium RIFCSPHIGHO2_12_FULL_40_20]